MTGKRRKVLGGAAAGAVLLITFVWWTHKGSDVPVFKIRPYYDEDLFLRYERPDGDILITRRRGMQDRPVYRYKVESAQLELARREDWNAATGEIMSSLRSEPEPISGRISGTEEGKLALRLIANRA